MNGRPFSTKSPTATARRPAMSHWTGSWSRGHWAEMRRWTATPSCVRSALVARPSC